MPALVQRCDDSVKWGVLKRKSYAVLRIRREDPKVGGGQELRATAYRKALKTVNQPKGGIR